MKIIFWLLIILTLGCSSSEEKPNIVMIMVDDMGFGDLSCFGSEEIHTPNLDWLAKNGMMLTDFHSNGPICSPTRAALLTGRYQQRAGIEAVVSAANHRETGMSPSQKIIPEYLSEAGYQCGIIGKWHLGYDKIFGPMVQGFNIFRGFVSGNVDYISHRDQENHEDWWSQDDLVTEDGYLSDLITDHSIQFIDTATKPFFLYVAHGAPHYPYQNRSSEPERTVDTLIRGGRKGIEKHKMYIEMVEIMDEGVGKIIESLENKGILNSTLILFFSDNGPAGSIGSSGSFKGSKGSVYEGGHRVPFIAHYPGKILPNTVSEHPGITMDILPSFLDLLDLPVEGFDGESLWPVLNGSQQPQALSRTFMWKLNQKKAIRVNNWKAGIQGTDTFLINLELDPSEEHNLRDSLPTLYKELSLKLDSVIVEITKGVDRKS